MLSKRDFWMDFACVTASIQRWWKQVLEWSKAAPQPLFLYLPPPPPQFPRLSSLRQHHLTSFRGELHSRGRGKPPTTTTTTSPASVRLMESIPFFPPPEDGDYQHGSTQGGHISASTWRRRQATRENRSGKSKQPSEKTRCPPKRQPKESASECESCQSSRQLNDGNQDPTGFHCNHGLANRTGRRKKKKTSKAAAHLATLGPLFTAGEGKQGRKKCKQIHAWGNPRQHNPHNDLSV